MIAGLGSGRRELVRAQPAAPRRQAETYLACSPTSHRMICEITHAAARSAPLLIGGEGAPGPLGGEGFAALMSAARLEELEARRRGGDLILTGYRNGCLQALSSSVGRS